MAPEDPTVKARRVWDAYAPRYDRSMGPLERLWFGTGRERVCAQARGETLEVAVGTGLNIPCYPDDVLLTGVDLSPAMLAVARNRATGLGRPVELVEADAAELPFADGRFDTVVCTLSLCTIPDPWAAVTEMHRVLRPGGRLLLLDHVASTWWPIRGAQHLVEAVTVRLAGEHYTRRSLPLVARAGFRIDEAERRTAGTVERIVATRTG